MESGGLPGRVHISEKTVQFLNNEFELEDGSGYSREETIRLSGLKTYLIVRVIKPYPEGTLDEKSINQNSNNLDINQANSTALSEQQKLLQDVTNQTIINDTNNNTNSINNDGPRKASNAIARSSITGQHTSTIPEQIYPTNSQSSIHQLGQGMGEYQRRLRYELLNRDNVQTTQRILPFTFSFSDKNYEHDYMNNSDETAGVSLTGFPLTILLITFSELTLGVSSCFSFIVLISSSLLQSFLALLSTVNSWAGRRYSYTNDNSFETRQLSRYSSTSGNSIFNKYRLSDERTFIPKCLPKPFTTISSAVQHKAIVRLIVYGLMILIWLSTSVIVNLDYYYQTQNLFNLNETTNLEIKSQPSDQQLQNKDELMFKSLYLNYYIVLFVLAISALKRISLLVKMIIVFACTVIQTSLNFYFHRQIIELLDRNWYGISLEKNGHLIYLTLLLLSVTISCFVLNRQFEIMSRRLFLWQKEVEERKLKVKEMKRKNETLLYNILPLHVAIHFLGRRKRDDDLYSKSYKSVGVLFASVPNFTEFYTEESVNNQGLECLRFLNEIISDFDGLLDKEEFKSISKIKTISSTYMAASGLTLENDTEIEDVDLVKRWSHLADLTHFALGLKEALENINEQSFNKFVLKIGKIYFVLSFCMTRYGVIYLCSILNNKEKEEILFFVLFFFFLYF